MIALSVEHMLDLVAGRDHWINWADAEERLVSKGVGFVPNIEIGRRVAKSFQMEIDTGMPHCACCLKPICAEKPYWKR